MKESDCKRYEDLPLFLNTATGMSIREVENQVRKWNLLLSARRDLPAGSECR